MINRILITSIFSAALILTGCTGHVPVASLVTSYSQTDADEQITSTDILSSVTDKDTDYAGVNTPSPIESMTLEQICEELNLTLSFPITAQNIQKINGDPTIYEMDFTQDHHTCTFRFAKTDTLEDISGMYYDWTRSTYDPTADQLYTCEFTDEGQGICQWMQDGYSMSLSMDTDASEDFFSGMYSLITDNFHPSETIN